MFVCRSCANCCESCINTRTLLTESLWYQINHNTSPIFTSDTLVTGMGHGATALVVPVLYFSYLNRNICVDICRNHCSLILFGGPYNIGSSTSKQEEPPPLSYQFSTTPPPPSASLLPIRKVSLRGFLQKKRDLLCIWFDDRLVKRAFK